MSRLLCSVSLLCALSTFAQKNDFAAANSQLTELSYSKACDSFTELNKHDSTNREVMAKKIIACAHASKASWSDANTFATSGAKDFARAVVAGHTAIQGYQPANAAIELLKAESKGESRQAREAAALLVAVAMTELQRNSYNRPRADAMAQLVIGFSTDANELAHAKFLRAQGRLNDATTTSDGEKEMAEVASGSTEWADDATYTLGTRYESQAKYTKALEVYDGAKRFSTVTANYRSSSLQQAENIRRKSLTVNINRCELVGENPTVTVSWRNVKNGVFTVKRVDPGTFVEPKLRELFQRGTVVSTFTSKLEVKSDFAPGSEEIEFKGITEAGAYVLEAKSEGLTSYADVLVTQLGLISKTDRTKIMVFVSDVETGAASPNAEVTLFRETGSKWSKLTAAADASGLATFRIEPDQADDTMWVWAHVGNHWAYGRAGNWWSSGMSRQELGYVMFDRPLYKPAETVGLKLYLRSRDAGASMPTANAKVHLTITDPQGKTIAEPELTTNSFGTATYSLKLAKNAPLGAYHCSISKTEHSLQQLQYGFRVEEYKPPEYAVSVEAVGNPMPGDAVRFKVKASYFSGGAVANAQGRALIRVTNWTHYWGKWPGEETPDDGAAEYSDDDDSGRGYRFRSQYSYNPVIAQHTVQFKTGADGTAEFEVPKAPSDETRPSLLFSAEVLITDASRREIAGAGSVKVTATQYFVDIRTNHFIYKPGEKVAAQLRAEDPNGRPVDAEVISRLVRLTPDGRPGAKIAEARTKISKGRGLLQLDADALGMVRLEIAGASKPEVVLNQTELWLTNEAKAMAPVSRGFQLYTGKAPAKVGEPIRILIASDRPGGHAWLTLENEDVHASKVVELAGRARFVEMVLPAELSPNGWLTATRFEDAQFRIAQRPVNVVGSDTTLDVKVNLGRPAVEPGSTIKATVSIGKGPSGAPAEIAMTVVDNALFAIEAERTDFLSFFARQRRQLTVRTWSTLNERSFTPRRRAGEKPAANGSTPEPVTAQRAPPEAEMSRSMKDSDDRAGLAAAPSAKAAAARDGAVGNKEEKSKNPGEIAGEEVRVRSDFGSSAGWFAAVKGSVGSSISQAFTLTDSLTSWKAVATVVTESAFAGQGSATVRASKPLMVRLQAPRFFIENDEVTLSAVIESHLPKATEVEVTIGAPGFKPIGNASKTLKVEPEQIVRFDAKFKVAELGERTVRATVKGGGTSDAMEWRLPALVHGSAQRQFFSGRMSDSFKFEFDLPAKRKPSLTQLELVLTPSVLSAMFDSLPYLASYPYGCVEQTLSRFVPAVIARKVVKDFNLPAERVPANLDDMVTSGLDRLMGFQHFDGGWGWWNSDSTNRWMTAYVVYALSLTKEAGVPVNAAALANGRKYLLDHLGEGLNEPDTHAFMIFALSATGSVPKGGLDGDYNRRTKLSPRARALLALAMLNARDSRARVAVENLDDIVKAAQARKDASAGEANDVWSTSAAIEATAFTLMAMMKHDMASPMIAPLTDFLVLRRNGGKWRNTRDTAFAVYALAELSKREAASLRGGSFVVFLNGQEHKRSSFVQGGLDLKPLLLSDSAFKAGHNVVEVKRDSGGTGYFAATFDVFNQNDFIKGVGGDVAIKRTYTLLGKPSTEKASSPTEYGMPVEAGTRIRVDVDITANKAVEFVMIEDLKAAGFEAVMLKSGPEVCNFACSHAELRTDRVAMFLSELRVGTTRLSYELRAEVPGKFAALPARIEAMYAPEIQATADEMRFEVRDEPAGVARQ